MAESKECLWQIVVSPAVGQVDRVAEHVLNSVKMGLVNLGGARNSKLQLHASRGFLLQGEIDRDVVERVAKKLLVESVVEDFQISPVLRSKGDSERTDCDDSTKSPRTNDTIIIHVLPKPGVTDAEADSALNALKLLGAPVNAVRTFRKFMIEGISESQARSLASKLLANESIEQIVVGPLKIDRLDVGNEYQFNLGHIELLQADEKRLQEISRTNQLSLTLIEMQTIQTHYRELDREPTDIELETIAQTWSEHCSHKTLAGRIEYQDENGTRYFDNMLKETIFAATQNIRKKLGADDWCVSVFVDNAGVVKFDDEFNLTFKVETHNRPSAIEPYGGASTGIGGVIRDTLGTGMGAKPICNTDVFCFADPNTSLDEIPPGVMHPRRIINGVVSGVRDYGNRMGIPTVNGAVYFDQRYIGNPLVFCGNVGLLPHEHSFKHPQENDLIVSIGGRTGRDGIHGATFSSAELTDSSDQTSSGAVQIGNPIVEKIVVDVLLEARDQGLFNAITDCGAGGFSSAVGEMGEKIGAEVWLEKAPLKYDGLSYTEIWISEAQERMVCSVPEEKWERFRKLCEDEGVEASIIGKFTPTGMLTLKYKETMVGQLSMEFMHNGRPGTVRKATFQLPETKPLDSKNDLDLNQALLAIMSSLNVASKHWIIRQYDHEVLGRSAIKPLVGKHNDGPSDAAVIRPRLDSKRGAAISCGMNPHFGDHDPYHMAASSINEAIRNCVAVGADPKRIAILDNFCWGYTDRPETLGTLVRAALACQEVAEAYGTPFISGKDSLNNEFSYSDSNGERQTISIPSTLLISALGQVPDVNKCVTMDFKRSGNALYQLGETENELAGSHFALIHGLNGGQVPVVDTTKSLLLFETIHQAMLQGLIRSCHDLSEGGLAASLAEMALAGRLGCEVDLRSLSLSANASPSEISSNESEADSVITLFSESNSRFVIEVLPENQAKLESMFAGQSCTQIGFVTEQPVLKIVNDSESLIELPVNQIHEAWRSPLDWNRERMPGNRELAGESS